MYTQRVETVRCGEVVYKRSVPCFEVTMYSDRNRTGFIVEVRADCYKPFMGINRNIDEQRKELDNLTMTDVRKRALKRV